MRNDDTSAWGFGVLTGASCSSQHFSQPWWYCTGHSAVANLFIDGQQVYEGSRSLKGIKKSCFEDLIISLFGRTRIFGTLSYACKSILTDTLVK
jgi:hypothetical protein